MSVATAVDRPWVSPFGSDDERVMLDP